MIIGVSGYSGSGKDTIAKIIQYLMADDVGNLEVKDVVDHYKHHSWFLEQQSTWKIKKFAEKLKIIANLLTGIPVEKFEDLEFKKTELKQEWSDRGIPITVRDFLQRLGTDSLRNGLHYNTWINALMANYVGEKTCDCEKECRCLLEYPKWVITDCRFPNEARTIKNKGGIIIRVDRPNIKLVNNHPSETSLDSWDFDYKIVNASDHTSLAFTVATILKKIGYEPKRIPEYSPRSRKVRAKRQ